MMSSGIAQHAQAMMPMASASGTPRDQTARDVREQPRALGIVRELKILQCPLRNVFRSEHRSIGQRRDDDEEHGRDRRKGDECLRSDPWCAC